MDNELIEVIQNLIVITEKGVAAHNKASDGAPLIVRELPPEFLDIFLDIPGRNGGFCIISLTKLVVAFDEYPNSIVFIGRKRSNNNAKGKGASSSRQLLKLSFSKPDDSYEYKDNVGGAIDLKDIVTLLIKWTVSS